MSAMALVGGIAGFFDEGFGFALAWVGMVALVYLGLMRWGPMRNR
jgi:hypothetical protein